MLVWVSVLLTMAMMILTSFLPGKETGDHNTKAKTSIEKLQKVEEAMKGFMVANGRRPCPASGTYDVNSASFGVESATPGTCTGGTPSANFSGTSVTASGTTTSGLTTVTGLGSTSSLTVGMGVSGVGIPLAASIASVDSSTQVTLTVTANISGNESLTFTNTLVGGVIPTKSLGLPDDYAMDEFGHRFTYVVDSRATSKSSCNVLTQTNIHDGLSSGVTIENSTSGGTLLDRTMYAYISHGKDGHGAFPVQGSSVANRINSGTTDTDKLTNAGVNSSFTYSTSAFTNIKVRKEPTSTFDDSVYYGENTKNTCCMGPTCNQGFRMDGEATNAQLGRAGIALGDVNGDGIPDLIIAEGNFNTSTAVVFGTRNGFPNPLPLSSLDGTNGFKLTGVSGYRIATGDINGDGYSDIITFQSSNNTLNGYVIFGGPTRKDGTAWAATQTLSSLANGTNGFQLANAANLGPAINVAVGDINGDKADDIIFNGNLSGGTTYVLLGSNGTWAGGSTVDFTSLNSTTTPKGFTITRSFRGSIGVGDMNGDGYADIAMNDSGSAPGRSDNKGVLAVIYGSPTIGSSNYNLVTTPLNGTNGFYIYMNASSKGGWSGTQGFYADTDPQRFLAMGDVNGDGYSDLLFSVPSASYWAGVNGEGFTAGTIYVIFGSPGTPPKINDIDQLVANGSATRIDGPLTASAFATNIALSDMNGDGYADIVATSRDTSINTDQSVYVVFGHGGPWAIRNLYSNPPLGGIDGVRFDCSYAADQSYCGGVWNGYGLWGTSASATSTDINGDGIGDIFIPSYLGTSASGLTQAGYIYTVLGKKNYNWPAVFKLNSIY